MLGEAVGDLLGLVWLGELGYSWNKLKLGEVACCWVMLSVGSGLFWMDEVEFW